MRPFRPCEADPPPRPSLVRGPAATVRGVSPTGEPVMITPGSLDLLFMSSTCVECAPLWVALDPSRPRRLVVVTPDPTGESPRAVADRAAGRAEVVMSSQAWWDYAVGPAPWQVVISDGRVTAEGHIGTWPELGAVPQPTGETVSGSSAS